MTSIIVAHGSCGSTLMQCEHWLSGVKDGDESATQKTDSRAVNALRLAAGDRYDTGRRFFGSAMTNIETTPDESRRSVRSFVRREGRITKGQKRALAELLPPLEVDLNSSLPLDVPTAFGREAPLTIEIGFGDGGALVEMATAEPEVNFIGAEVYRPGVGKMLLGLEENALTNVRVFADDATQLLASGIAEQSVDRILVYFPDPWPKKRHLKRRLVQSDFAALAASRLKSGGVLHVATDIESYAEQVVEILEACDELANTVESTYSPRPQWRPETKYERRGTRLGHSVFDMIYRRC